MGLLKRVWYWLLAKNPALTPDERLSRWLNVITVGTIVWSVGGGAIGLFLNHPWAGVGVGLAVWVGFLNLIAFIGKRTQPTAPPETEDTDSAQEQETKIERLEAVIRRQQEMLNRYDGDRIRFEELLTDAYTEGMDLRQSEPEEEAAQGWANHLKTLLERSLGDYWVDRVVSEDPSFRSSKSGSTDEQKWMESRLNRLDDFRR